jgi:hypothetical protein
MIRREWLAGSLIPARLTPAISRRWQMPALMVKVWKVEKEQAVLFKVVSDPETFELLQQAVKDLQSVNVWPYPGVVEETMASRGVQVRAEVDQEASEQQAVVRVRKA